MRRARRNIAGSWAPRRCNSPKHIGRSPICFNLEILESFLACPPFPTLPRLAAVVGEPFMRNPAAAPWPGVALSLSVPENAFLDVER